MSLGNCPQNELVMCVCVWVCVCVCDFQIRGSQFWHDSTTTLSLLWASWLCTFCLVPLAALAWEMVCGSPGFLGLPHGHSKWTFSRVKTTVFKFKIHQLSCIFRYKVPVSSFSLQRHSALFSLKSNFFKGSSKVDMNMLI